MVPDYQKNPVFSVWGRRDNLKHFLQDFLVRFSGIFRDAVSSKQTDTCENEGLPLYRV